VYLYVPTLVGLSVVIALRWNRSRRSVIIAIALHASFNASSGLFDVSGEDAMGSDVQFVAQGVLAAAWVGTAIVLAVKHDDQLGRPASDASADGALE
jgi:membrane protease YdiL (CAAX protease family)